MIVGNSNYVLISKNNNAVYWKEGLYPDWSLITTFLEAGGKIGTGVEPHYHDCDEFWLFTTGRGEAWLDGKSYEITPNTVVYTPMGAVHRFQMFSDYETVAIITCLERQKRAKHILVEEEGPPVPTVPGFVIPGMSNNGPFANRGPRCPLSELRLFTFAASERFDKEHLPQNEHWLALGGTLYLTVGGSEIELSQGDVALLKTGVVREVRSYEGGCAALARE